MEPFMFMDPCFMAFNLSPSADVLDRWKNVSMSTKRLINMSKGIESRHKTEMRKYPCISERPPIISNQLGLPHHCERTLCKYGLGSIGIRTFDYGKNIRIKKEPHFDISTLAYIASLSGRTKDEGISIKPKLSTSHVGLNGESSKITYSSKLSYWTNRNNNFESENFTNNAKTQNAVKNENTPHDDAHFYDRSYKDIYGHFQSTANSEVMGKVSSDNQTSPLDRNHNFENWKLEFGNSIGTYQNLEIGTSTRPDGNGNFEVGTSTVLDRYWTHEIGTSTGQNLIRKLEIGTSTGHERSRGLKSNIQYDKIETLKLEPFPERTGTLLEPPHHKTETLKSEHFSERTGTSKSEHPPHKTDVLKSETILHKTGTFKSEPPRHKTDALKSEPPIRKTETLKSEHHPHKIDTSKSEPSIHKTGTLKSELHPHKTDGLKSEVPIHKTETLKSEPHPHKTDTSSEPPLPKTDIWKSQPTLHKIGTVKSESPLYRTGTQKSEPPLGRTRDRTSVSEPPLYQSGTGILKSGRSQDRSGQKVSGLIQFQLDLPVQTGSILPSTNADNDRKSREMKRQTRRKINLKPAVTDLPYFMSHVNDSKGETKHQVEKIDVEFDKFIKKFKVKTNSKRKKSPIVELKYPKSTILSKHEEMTDEEKCENMPEFLIIPKGLNSQVSKMNYEDLLKLLQLRKNPACKNVKTQRPKTK